MALMASAKYLSWQQPFTLVQRLCLSPPESRETLDAMSLEYEPIPTVFVNHRLILAKITGNKLHRLANFIRVHRSCLLSGSHLSF